MGQPAPTEVIEVKSSLSAPDKSFACRLADGRPGFAVLRYVSPIERTVHGVTLPAGTITFGYFWSDRPYNVYHWLRPSGETIAHYFNVADRTQISDGRVAWRDLTVDILVTPFGTAQVLDEDELPQDLDAHIRAHIESAKAAILAGLPALVADIETRSHALWSRAADQP